MQTVAEFVAPHSDGELSELYGRHRTYWCHVRHGKKELSRPAALAIWRLRQVKLGPIANMADEDVAVLARLEAAQ